MCPTLTMSLTRSLSRCAMWPMAVHLAHVVRWDGRAAGVLRQAAGGGVQGEQRIILGIDSGLVDTIWAINGAFGKTTTCRASTVGQACCLVRGLKIPRNGANGFQPLSLSARFDFHDLSVCVILPCPSDS